MNWTAYLEGFLEKWAELDKSAVRDSQQIHYPKPPIDDMAEHKKRLRLRRSGRNSGEQHKKWLEDVTGDHPGKLRGTTSGRHRP